MLLAPKYNPACSTNCFGGGPGSPGKPGGPTMPESPFLPPPDHLVQWSPVQGALAPLFPPLRKIHYRCVSYSSERDVIKGEGRFWEEFKMTDKEKAKEGKKQTARKGGG